MMQPFSLSFRRLSSELSNQSFVPLRKVSNRYRGRDTHYWVPPAQHRTGGFPASGAHLGWVTTNRRSGQG